MPSTGAQHQEHTQTSSTAVLTLLCLIAGDPIGKLCRVSQDFDLSPDRLSN